MNLKRWLPVLLALLVLLACNLPSQSLPVFIAPSGAGSATPDWAATLQAAAPTETGPTPQVEGTSQTEPISQPAATPAPPSPAISEGPILYYSQAGDTLAALAVRFGVQVGEIESPDPIPAESFINPNQLLIIPNRLTNTTSSLHLLPDSEVVYAFSGVDFDTQDFVTQADGYLNGYHEYLSTNGETYGGELVELLALDNSINPRLLLALLEYQSGWVYGQPSNLAQRDYPMGQIDNQMRGLLRQMKWVVNQLSIGYYGWREGRLSQIQFRDGVSVRMAPDLNAGTAALQYYFAQVYDSHGWVQALDPENGFPALYADMFGNPWMRARAVEPLFPANLTQPNLELPFLIGTMWNYTGGPHGAWERDGSWAAIDFAPSSNQSGCVDSDAWVTASAPGLILRSERGIVVLDIDGDGLEQTGWVLVYLHITSRNAIQAGEWVQTGDLLGHPSCEGGLATGTHVHLARKYNGEWMTADGPIPFVLSGWRVHAGSAPYKGTLTRGDEIVTANQFGAFESRIRRERQDP